jgi:hypothetical protein
MWITLLALSLGGCKQCAKPSPEPPQPPRSKDPPARTLTRISLAPLPTTLARLARLGQALSVWRLEGKELWEPLQSLLEGAHELAAHVQWDRPLHVLVLRAPQPPPARGTAPRPPGAPSRSAAAPAGASPAALLSAGPGGRATSGPPPRLVWVLPVAEPPKALAALAERCDRAKAPAAGLSRFAGGGEALLPCRFVAKALARGLVVGQHAEDVTLSAPHARHLLRAEAPAPPSLELRVFTKALRARLGLSPAKLERWAGLGAMALAVALGDFTAAADLKARFARLLEHVASVSDLGVSLDLRDDGLAVRLFATGREGGALARWIGSRQPTPMRLHRDLAPGAAVLLGLARTGPLPGAPRARRPRPRRPPASAGDRASGAQTSSSNDSSKAETVGPLARLAIGKLPAALQGPARRLWRLLTADAGELATALRAPTGEAGKDHRGSSVGLALLVEHPDPAALQPRWSQALRDLIRALPGLPALGIPKGAVTVTRRKEGEVDVLEVSPAEAGGTFAAVLRYLGTPDRLPVAVAHGDQRLAVAAGANAVARARALAQAPAGASGDPHAPHAPGAPATPRAPGAHASPPPPARPAAALPPGRLGLLQISLVQLGRLVPELVRDEDLPAAPAGALTLHWGVDAAHHQVDLGLDIPVRHLAASAALWNALARRLQGGEAGALPAWLGQREEIPDAL